MYFIFSQMLDLIFCIRNIYFYFECNYNHYTYISHNVDYYNIHVRV